MQFHLPPFAGSIQSIPAYLQNLYRVMTSAFISVVSTNEAVPRIILRSPNGTNYTITVDDAGTVLTAVASKTGS